MRGRGLPPAPRAALSEWVRLEVTTYFPQSVALLLGGRPAGRISVLLVLTLSRREGGAIVRAEPQGALTHSLTRRFSAGERASEGRRGARAAAGHGAWHDATRETVKLRV